MEHGSKGLGNSRHDDQDEGPVEGDESNNLDDREPETQLPPPLLEAQQADAGNHQQNVDDQAGDHVRNAVGQKANVLGELGHVRHLWQGLGLERFLPGLDCRLLLFVLGGLFPLLEFLELLLAAGLLQLLKLLLLPGEHRAHRRVHCQLKTVADPA